MIQCRHVTCHACACAGCAALLDELDALRAERDRLMSEIGIPPLVKRIQSEVRAEIIAYINLIADDYHKAEHVMQAGIVRYVAQAVQRNVGAK